MIGTVYTVVAVCGATDRRIVVRSKIDGFIMEFNNMKKMMMKNLKVWADSTSPLILYLIVIVERAAGYGYGCLRTRPAYADPAGDGCPSEEGEEAEAYPGRGCGVRGQVTRWMVVTRFGDRAAALNG